MISKFTFKHILQLLIMLSISLASDAASEFKIFTLQHRFAEDILPTIQAIVGSNGTTSAIQNQLIVRTDSQTMIEVEQTIATLDTARENLKIRVKRQNNMTGSSNNASVKGRTRIGNVEIQTGNDSRRGRDGVNLGLENNQTRSQQSSEQFIQVADGAPAYISIGESVPYTSEWVLLTQRYAVKQTNTEFIEIGTGFTVRARSIGRQVELDITPTFSKLKQYGRLEFEQLTSTVMVERNEWVNIGGIMQEKDEISRTILSSKNGRSYENNQIFIRVE
ncbi:secretin N-terminal domain-containing protein [Methylotenera sp.]|uniref:secretin N-terminal domain-containing protein n=1 Tax=Methylotenera sp. TaxID=2051956 RepID=UPI0027357B00|nr:secretin N-terminal domain-containing protein [Methylotenera sp.]MDP3210215.1 nodulation protein NolW [Methylotenera sp.]